MLEVRKQVLEHILVDTLRRPLISLYHSHSSYEMHSNKAYVRTADLHEVPALSKVLRRAFINDPITNLEEVRDNRFLLFPLDLAQFAGGLFYMTPTRLDDLILRTSNT